MLMSWLCNNTDVSSVLDRDLVSDLFDERERESCNCPPASHWLNVWLIWWHATLNSLYCIRSHISRVCVCVRVCPFRSRAGLHQDFEVTVEVTVENKCIQFYWIFFFLIITDSNHEAVASEVVASAAVRTAAVSWNLWKWVEQGWFQ